MSGRQSQRRAVVAGGGILGTWHALELAAAGFTVEHLEAEAGPMGASVRNFGLVWVSGRRSGAELDVARRARRRWEEVGAAVPGIGFRPMSSLTVACDASARAVMQAFAAHPDAAARSISFLEPDEVRACNPAVRGDVAGALHGADDAVVEPCRAGGVARIWPRPHGKRTRFQPGRRVVARRGPRSSATTGTRWEGDVVVLATGAAYDHLPGTEPIAARLRRVRLQMLETSPFARQRSATSLAGVDTLRYYPAYEVGAPWRCSESRARSQPITTSETMASPAYNGELTIEDTAYAGELVDFALERGPDPRDPRPACCLRIHSGRRFRPSGAAGRASTHSASTATSACASRSTLACGW